MMHYAKYQTTQQGRYISEDNTWHDYDIVLPSDNYIRREKEHLTGFLLMWCEHDTTQDSQALIYRKKTLKQGFYFME